jgi:hypothetical protein
VPYRDGNDVCGIKATDATSSLDTGVPRSRVSDSEQQTIVFGEISLYYSRVRGSTWATQRPGTMNELDSIATVGASATWKHESFGCALNEDDRNRKRLGPAWA